MVYCKLFSQRNQASIFMPSGDSYRSSEQFCRLELLDARHPLALSKFCVGKVQSECILISKISRRILNGKSGPVHGVTRYATHTIHVASHCPPAAKFNQLWWQDPRGHTTSHAEPSQFLALDSLRHIYHHPLWQDSRTKAQRLFNALQSWFYNGERGGAFVGR